MVLGSVSRQGRDQNIGGLSSELVYGVREQVPPRVVTNQNGGGLTQEGTFWGNVQVEGYHQLACTWQRRLLSTKARTKVGRECLIVEK